MKRTIYILCIIALISAMAVPATAEYVAEHKKMSIYEQGAGDLAYTYGTPFYQCIWGYDSVGSNAETATYNINLSSLPDNAVEARLYVYWTWSAVDVCDKLTYMSWYRDYAVYPELEVEFNGETVSFDYADGTNWIDHYTDAKNISAVGLQYGQPGYQTYNFPSGTNCSSIPLNLVSGNNAVNVTNVKSYQGPDCAGYCTGSYISSINSGRARVCIQGVGLLLTLEDDDKMYWIAEGNDMTYTKWKNGAWTYGITPDMTITKVKFPGPVPSGMDTATLTSVVPAGDLGYNRLYFNALSEYWWDGLWNSVPDKNLAVSETDVSAALRSQNNMARFQNGLENPNNGDKQMNVANAFLVVE